MLNSFYEKKLAKYHKEPKNRYKAICPYCMEIVKNGDIDAEYVKTKYSEHFFHGACLYREIASRTKETRIMKQ